MTRPARPDPYCAFKDDKERRLALQSRDRRLIAIAVVTAVVGPCIPSLLAWLYHLAP